MDCPPRGIEFPRGNFALRDITEKNANDIRRNAVEYIINAATPHGRNKMGIVLGTWAIMGIIVVGIAKAVK